MEDEAMTVETTEENKAVISAEDEALVKRIVKRIKDDKLHHKKAFERMKRGMQLATWGGHKDWVSPSDNEEERSYTANIIGRHIKMKTAALYAKNPKAVARTRDTMDFAVWDGNLQTLMGAMQTVQMAQTALSMGDTSAAVAMQEAQAIIEDYKAGTERRTFLRKYGKTLEVLFAYFMREQKPLDFKTSMKRFVRRALVTGVAYLELGFERETGQRAEVIAQMTDAKDRIAHLEALMGDLQEGEIAEGDAELAELRLSLENLAAQEEVVIREGLVMEYPQSTKVIPDRRCKQLVGFIGADHVTVEEVLKVSRVQERYKVDLGKGYTKYTVDGETSGGVLKVSDDEDDNIVADDEECVRVWRHYDKTTGLVYHLAEGYRGFLAPPAAPTVFVEDFWPIYALTFNEVENEDELFPPSDVELLADMQFEHNRARQGAREHRIAARPKWLHSNGALEEEDVKKIAKMRPFEALGVNLDPQFDIRNVFQSFPVPGVDPNLYETAQLFGDMQLVSGAQEAQYGGVSKATATESAIAANSTTASDSAAIDDLDMFLTLVARAAGQILQREMSQEKVAEIVGPGAVWVEATLEQIANEVMLEVEAGSTGKPNQAVEINNWKQLLPSLLQMPNLNQEWLLRETLRRLDDRLDVTEAVAAGLPSIAATNQNLQVTGASPENDPNMQGAAGASNAPVPDQQVGTDAAFGSNQV